MKYIVILGDGMADHPIKNRENKTPLELAKKPYIDKIAANGQIGMAKTVPDEFSPGSDVANLSVLGYCPKKYYSGRSPLEAMSIGVDMADDDIAIRCNLASISTEGSFADAIMKDYSSSEISTKDADVLIKYLQEKLGNDEFSFYTGTSYRHCLIWKRGKTQLGLTPPHDISGKPIKPYIDIDAKLYNLMKSSYELLKDHPLNAERIKQGLNPANIAWFWGEGTKPMLSSFKEKTGLKGAMISAVDLLKGIGICAKMDVINVEGATGTIKTNFEGKAQATIDALKTHDFVYLHLEAPDECGHQGEIDDKIKSIEIIDQKIVKPIIDASRDFDAIKILITPDHPTPLDIMTHTRDAIPYAFAIAKNGEIIKSSSATGLSYTELNCASQNSCIEDGSKLIDEFLGLE